ncbi:hydroxymethylpyrimidine/phosphomethylpyrimidine kinase [Methylocystaceae bacterium]|nr:hydroxymethylpyrimidine/phosphomethylpyrimidine kinase [Methylocystaceae bacterium]
MTHKKPPILLTIAGSDPSGGAGLQGDLKTFSAHGCYGMAAITAITVQNTCGVLDYTPIEANLVAAQISALLKDIIPNCIKIGMIGTIMNALAVRDSLKNYPHDLVIDPVLTPTQGVSLSAAGLEDALLGSLIPLSRVVTPNIYEASVLTKTPLAKTTEEMVMQGKILLNHGAQAVLVTGGDLSGPPIDVLIEKDRTQNFIGERVNTRHSHGTGCALSSAIACHLAKGTELSDAINLAKHWLSSALAAADQLELTQGRGPPNHFFELWD